MPFRAPARERLLDAADELFAADGWAATPVDAVLARAEVAPATLYAHFASKDRLLAATLERRLDRWDEAWADAVAAAPDDRARLLAVFDALRDFHLRSASARWCAFLGAAAEGSTSEPAVDEAVRRDAALLRERLGGLAVAVAGDRAEELTEHLLVVVSGCLAMRLRAPEQDHVATSRATAELLVDAVVGWERFPA